MEVTVVSDPTFADPMAWVIGFFVALVLAAGCTFLIFKHTDGKPTKKEIGVGVGFSVLLFAVLMAATMWFIDTRTHDVAVYEGKVTSVSEPTQVMSKDFLIATMEGVDKAMHVVYAEGGQAAVDTIQSLEDEEAAFLCQEQSYGRYSPNLLVCEVLADAPDSTELEQFKTMGM